MKSTFLVLLLLLTYTSNAQDKNIDSQNQLSVQKMDTTQVWTLLDLSNEYLNSRPDTALILTLQGLALTRQMKFVRGELNSLNQLGNIFMVTGNYPKSLENFLYGLKIAERINDQRREAIIYSNIGLLYNYQDDYNLALEYYYKAKSIAESIKNDLVLKLVLINIGDNYEKLNQLDSALIYTQQAHELTIRLDDVNSRGIALNNLGNIYSKMGESSIAMKHYRLSIIDFIVDNDDEGICEDAWGMAKLFKKMGQSDSVLYYAHLSLTAATRGGFTKSILIASNFLSEYYESIHLIDSAFAYQKITIAAKDSLFSQAKSKELQNLVFAEKLRQKEIETAKAQAIETRKKNIQMAGIGAFIPTFFGIILLFNKRKTKPKTIEFLGMLGLLFLFEFISMLIGPYFAILTNQIAVFMFVTQICVALILIPVHQKLEKWVKEILAFKNLQVTTRS